MEILVNNESVQAVREKTLNATGMVFWKAGSFDGITASEAMTLMTEEKDGVMTVVVSDPTQKLKTASVTISGKNLTLLENDRHIEAKTASGSTTLNIDFEESGGGTYTARFKIG